jgi:TDG/mug DNA glycosylase family protein
MGAVPTEAGPYHKRRLQNTLGLRDGMNTGDLEGHRINMILPDVLAPGLRIVFCGTAAGAVSAARGCYYAHPQNRFWRALHAAGLTPRLLAPIEFATLPDYGLGLTDIAKTVSGMDKQLPAGSLGRGPCEVLGDKIRAAQPNILAFTSLTAGRRFLKREAGFGEQSERLLATRIWLLPSPSPAANWNWDERWWRALGETARATAPSATPTP